MNSCPSLCDDIRSRASQLGAVATGFAEAMPVATAEARRYEDWVESDSCGEMAFCRRNSDVRHDPRLLLEGARTVICCAFPYPGPAPHGGEGTLGPRISAYAHGADYHVRVKDVLKQLGAYITGRYGGEVRACVDSAPMRERYWAERSGIGFLGVNGMLIVPGYGSYVFLGELLWTGTVDSYPVPPAGLPAPRCMGCGACVEACPGKALDGHGGCDARRCISYLTIEYRGDLPAEADLGGYAYGCDICQKVCPHNRGIKAGGTLFDAPTAIPSLTEAQLRGMSQSHFRRIAACSAMSRVPLRQLLRNIDHGKACE